MTEERFNEEMDKELLENGFKYYSDWEYGPQSAWSHPWEHYHMKLTRHSFGYGICIGRHASGENPVMPIGDSNSAAEIIKIRDLLAALY